MSYRHKFESAENASDYESRKYGAGSISRHLLALERPLLDRVLKRVGQAKPVHLDFACGTGRVLAYLVPRMQRSVGINVSESMLAIARAKVPEAELICTDISGLEAPVENVYDVITAFFSRMPRKNCGAPCSPGSSRECTPIPAWC